MEEIRLWKLDSTQGQHPLAKAVDPTNQTTTEKLLEDILVGSPDLLMPQLRLIGRQTETPGGPLDLLGIDDEGRLVVFELKRGKLTRDAVAQALDYASYLSELEPEELCAHIRENSGKGGILPFEDDFAHWYQGEFQRSVGEIGDPRVMLVGLGVDDRAKRMVDFLAKCELDISLITFHGFRANGEILLARQVEVQSRPPVVSTKRTKAENISKLQNLLNQLKIKSQYEELSSAVRQGLGPATYPWPNPVGYSFYLPETSDSGGPTNRAYIAMYCPEDRSGAIQVLLQARAVAAAGKDKVMHLAAKMDAAFTLKNNGCGEIWIDGHQPASKYAEQLKCLGEAIASGWKNKTESGSDAALQH